MNSQMNFNENPIANDVSTICTMANFAALELPLPSSFETRTLDVLCKNKYMYI